MKFKLPILLILSLFLLGSVSAALTTDNRWADGSQSAVISNGQSIDFYPYFFTMENSMNVKVELLDSQSNVIHTFLNTDLNCGTVCDVEYSYTLDKSIYGGAGTFSIIAQGTDSVGISQSSEITLKINPVITLDTTAPVITLNGANPQIIIQGNSYTELGASATDNVDGDLTSKIIIDSSAVNTNVIGSYNVLYNVKDAAGNNALTLTRIVKVISNSNPIDTTAPVITIQSPINGKSYNNQITSLSFIATDTNLASCSYSSDNGITKNQVACISGGLTTVSLTSGSGLNNWIVYATDSAGNTASSSISFTVDTSIPDTTAPTIIIVSPENKAYATNKITFKITTDENATAKFSIDGGSRITMANPFDDTFTYTLSGISNGNHTIVFYVKDASNNEANKSINFSINRKSSSGSGGGIGIVPQSTTSVPKIILTNSEINRAIISGHKESVLDEAPFYLILVITGLGIVIAGLVLVRKLRK